VAFGIGSKYIFSFRRSAGISPENVYKGKIAKKPTIFADL
jgi:hypothetical protein